MKKAGPGFHIEAGAGGTLAQAGYAMVATIIYHLGQDRLLAVRNSVPDFLAAYQEAAMMNPSPRPMPGAEGSQLSDCMGPLDPGVYEQIQELLQRNYPN